MNGGTPDVTELAGTLTDAETALCIAPPSPVAAALVERLYEEEGGRQPSVDGESREDPVRLLYPDGTTPFTTFERASAAAELTERGVLAIRMIDRVTQRLTVTDEQTYAHVETGDEVRSLAAADDSFRTSVRETYERQWAASGSWDPPVPARARFVQTFAEEFPDAGETLAAVLSAEPTVSRSGQLDPVTLVTLVGARHELQTLRLSEWAEALEFSSRTELSRVTGRLTEVGLIETERVPHGVGRPRQRLELAADALANCAPEELVPTARRLLDADSS